MTEKLTFWVSQVVLLIKNPFPNAGDIRDRGTPSSSWGFCPLVSAFRAHPLCFGACAHLSWLPWSVFSFAGFVFTFVSSVCPPSMLRGLCVLVLSHQSAFFVAGFMCSSFGCLGGNFGNPGLAWIQRATSWRVPEGLGSETYTSLIIQDVQLCATPLTAAHQAPSSLGFSRQEHWSQNRTYKREVED